MVQSKLQEVLLSNKSICAWKKEETTRKDKKKHIKIITKTQKHLEISILNPNNKRYNNRRIRIKYPKQRIGQYDKQLQ